ncbi:type 1 glutamine amidotransferase [Pseudomonadota bacterium]
MTSDKAGDAGKLKIAVFELGEIPEPLARKYPYYPRMIAEWISPSLPDADFTGMSPVTGDPLPEVDAFDGYIYSGSRHGIYEDLTWIEPLKEFIREATAAGKPQFGICFGHQIAAEALGGKAVKSDQGWGIGVHTYDMQLEVNGNTRQVPVMVMHQDQVIAVPETATVLGGNEFCPIGAVRYDNTVLTVQFHPEFSEAYMEDLLELRGGVTFPTDLTEEARKSLAQPVDSRLIADWAADFFRHNLAD